jgi:hypothetical protein
VGAKYARRTVTGQERCFVFGDMNFRLAQAEFLKVGLPLPAFRPCSPLPLLSTHKGGGGCVGFWFGSVQGMALQFHASKHVQAEDGQLSKVALVVDKVRVVAGLGVGWVGGGRQEKMNR